MNKLTATILSACMLLATTGAMATDAMKKDAMGKDAMAKEGMKKDAMPRHGNCSAITFMQTSHGFFTEVEDVPDQVPAELLRQAALAYQSFKPCAPRWLAPV